MASGYAGVNGWRKKNPEKVLAQSRRRYARRKEYIKTYQKRWRQAHLERERAKEAAYARMRRRTNPEMQRIRMKRFKAKVEMTLQEIAGRPRSQICELCQQVGKTVFDHDHRTGKFRGWLCQPCNRTLGQVKDGVSLVLKVADYVTKGGCDGSAVVSSQEASAQK